MHFFLPKKNLLTRNTNSGIWIRCPFHKEGKENTPSLKISANQSSYPIGNWKCFACGKKGKWNDLAGEIGLKKKKEDEEILLDLDFSKDDKKSLIEEPNDSSLSDNNSDSFLPWNKARVWRNISGEILSKINALLQVREFGDRIYLPVDINKEKVGGISGALHKSNNGSPSYIYDRGRWILKAVFPYDYTLNLLNKNNKRPLFLCEGPRDCLNLLQYGVPAVSILGGTTVWPDNNSKADLIMSLNPTQIILAFDPDEIGQQISRKVYMALKNEIPIKKIKFKYDEERKIKEDPGSMNSTRVLNLKEKIFR